MNQSVFRHSQLVKRVLTNVLKHNRPLTTTSFDSILKDVGKCRKYTETEGYVWNSPYGPINSPGTTIDQYIWKNLTKWKNHTAIECAVSGRKYTYADLRDRCAALAINLREKLGLKQNDVVAVCLPNYPEFVIALLGSIEAGLIVTTVNPLYTSEEISRQFISSQPKVVFTLAENYTVIKNACKLANQTTVKIIGLRTEPTQALVSDSIDFFELIKFDGLNLADANYNKYVKPGDVCALLYSSGTTGLPKGVMLTHNNLTFVCEAIDVRPPFPTIVRPTTNDFQEVLPCVAPFYHIYGLMPTLLTKLVLGCKIVTIPKFQINQYLQIVADHKSTFLCLVPPLVILLTNHENAKNFEHVRLVMSTGSNIAQADAERFRTKAVNAEFFQGYGLTETSPIVTLAPVGLQNYGTIGWPISNVQAKIVHVDDTTDHKGLDTHESGELWIRGPNIMKGYFKNEKATKEMITVDGWLRTGDIAHYDTNGLFYVNDRLKELIKVNAYPVAPAELEALLRKHPAILDAVVIGIPDAIYGEVPKAFVIRKPDSDLTESDVQTFIAKQVVKYKQLKGGVQFVESIPKSNTGKTLRKDVKKLFC